ncbi:MAG: glycosyltransferase [Candidatus Sumerlaeia bacterium]
MTAAAHKPRLMHIITAMTVGGAQTLLLDLLPELAADFDIQLVGLYPGRLSAEMRRRGIPVHELNHRRLFSPSTLHALIRLMRDFRPLIVHTQLGRADVYGRTAARLAGVPAIFSTSQNIDDWKKRPLFNALDNFTLRWARRLIAVSDEVRRFLVSRGVPENKITVVYNGVNIERKLALPVGFDRDAWRAQFGLTPANRLLTIIARLDEQKGHRFLIPAFARFAAARPHWRLLVVGDEGRINDEIKRLADACAPPGTVIFAGHRGDIPAVLASTDVFILPSLWEGHPLTLMEAMLWERPIIATRVGGIPEVIEHMTTGFLIEPGREEEIHGALVWMDDHPEQAAGMGRSAKRIALERCDVRRTADALRRLYREALADAARSAAPQP